MLFNTLLPYISLLACASSLVSLDKSVSVWDRSRSQAVLTPSSPVGRMALKVVFMQNITLNQGEVRGGKTLTYQPVCEFWKWNSQTLLKSTETFTAFISYSLTDFLLLPLQLKPFSFILLQPTFGCHHLSVEVINIFKTVDYR